MLTEREGTMYSVAAVDCSVKRNTRILLIQHIRSIS